MWSYIVGLLLLSVIAVCSKKRIKLKKQLINLKPMLQVVENSKDILYYCDTKPKLKYHYISPVVDEIFGTNSIEKHSKNPYYIYDIIHPDDYHILKQKEAGILDFSQPIILRLKDKKDKYIWFEDYVTPIIRNGEVVAVQGNFRNINDKIKLQQHLEYKVSHDALTGIHNREFFEAQLRKFNTQEDVSIAIIICDLDELKVINDQQGHKMGDYLLKETAKLLSECTFEGVKVARIGGDEFAIIMNNIDLPDVEVFLTNVQSKIDEFNDSSIKFKIKMSKGSAYHHSSLGQTERLFIEADKKMYIEKRNKIKVSS